MNLVHCQEHFCFRITAANHTGKYKISAVLKTNLKLLVSPQTLGVPKMASKLKVLAHLKSLPKPHI
jgi:hypothetical protein